jgi:hypothetical protein
MSAAEAIALIIGILVAGVTIGAVFADTFRALWWLLADRARGLRGPAPSYVPVYAAAPVPAHPRFGLLTDTPPEGIEVTRDGGVLSVRADQPVQRKLTDDHAPTGEFAAVPYTPPPPSWAQPPPTMAELRQQYDSWKQPVYGEVPVLAVDEAQRLAAGLIT